MEHTIFMIAGVLNSLFIIAVSLPLKRAGIITCSLAITILNLIQFFLTDNYASAVIAMITLAYGIIATVDNKYPILRSTPFISGFIALYFIAYVLTANQIISWEILVLIGSVTGMLAMMFINQINVKLIQILGNVCFTWFSFVIGAYGQLPGQFVSLAVLIGSLIYLLKEKTTSRITVQKNTSLEQPEKRPVAVP